MITNEQYCELVEKFPELENNDNIIKEVYAHFGLLFFKFSLVEHSLINILTYNHVGSELASNKIKNQVAWEQSLDKGYETARAQTFGNLIGKTVQIQEFSHFGEVFKNVKTKRDYLAHHFFREKVATYMIDEGCWHLLFEFFQIRKQLIELDKALTQPTKVLCERLRIPMPTNAQIEQHQSELLNGENTTPLSGKFTFHQ